jgi:hypothetical protein
MRNKAELITKISLLKRKIDQCLDERDQEAFNRLTFELRVCQRYLETRMNDTDSSVKEQLKQNRDKFFHY